MRNSIGKAGVAKVVKPHQDNPALWVWTVETQYFELLDGFKRDAHAEKKKVRGDVRSRPFSSVPRLQHNLFAQVEKNRMIIEGFALAKVEREKAQVQRNIALKASRKAREADHRALGVFRVVQVRVCRQCIWHHKRLLVRN